MQEPVEVCHTESLYQELVDYEEILGKVEDNFENDMKEVFQWTRRYLLGQIPKGNDEPVQIAMLRPERTDIEVLLDKSNCYIHCMFICQTC